MEPIPLASFKCADLGIDCSFKTTGTTKREVMRQFIDHAETDHNLPVLSADVIFRLQNVIKYSSEVRNQNTPMGSEIEQLSASQSAQGIGSANVSD